MSVDRKKLPVQLSSSSANFGFRPNASAWGASVLAKHQDSEKAQLHFKFTVPLFGFSFSFFFL
jgi:hypothetical protein